jgi:hypothetical protein
MALRAAGVTVAAFVRGRVRGRSFVLEWRLVEK